MRALRVTGTLIQGHKGCALEVPWDPALRWGPPVPLWPGRQGHEVTVDAQGLEFPSAIVGRSKRFWLLIPAEAMREWSLRPGDELAVSIRPRTD